MVIYRDDELPRHLPASERETGVIDPDVALLTHDHLRRPVRSLTGPNGLVVVGMSRTGERGFQMLYRFSGACDRLGVCGINVVFVYPRESARHVQDATSVLAARIRREPCLLLDESGEFFVSPPEPGSLCAIHLDHNMEQRESALIALGDETWDPQLHAFFERIAQSVAPPAPFQQTTRPAPAA